jgi:hypothetical protein
MRRLAKASPVWDDVSGIAEEIKKRGELMRRLISQRAICSGDKL